MTASGSEGGNCGIISVFELKYWATKYKQNGKREAHFLPILIRRFALKSFYYASWLTGRADVFIYKINVIERSIGYNPRAPSPIVLQQIDISECNGNYSHSRVTSDHCNRAWMETGRDSTRGTVLCLVVNYCLEVLQMNKGELVRRCYEWKVNRLQFRCW
jgi:hypothetical protein